MLSDRIQDLLVGFKAGGLANGLTVQRVAIISFVVLVLGLTLDYAYMLWMRTKLVSTQRIRPLCSLMPTILVCARLASWAVPLAPCGKYLHAPGQQAVDMVRTAFACVQRASHHRMDRQVGALSPAAAGHGRLTRRLGTRPYGSTTPGRPQSFWTSGRAFTRRGRGWSYLPSLGRARATS